jgi:hypothetical protein
MRKGFTRGPAKLGIVFGFLSNASYQSPLITFAPFMTAPPITRLLQKAFVVFATLTPIINAPGMAPIFLTLTDGLSNATRSRVANPNPGRDWNHRLSPALFVHSALYRNPDRLGRSHLPHPIPARLRKCGSRKGRQKITPGALRTPPSPRTDYPPAIVIFGLHILFRIPR